MADIYMHSRLAEDVVKDLKKDIDIDITFLGAQGPDPLYYNMFDKDYKRQRGFADDIHRYNTRDFMSNMVRYVKEHNNINTYSFLIGFICHYSMDVSIHPYIYNKVGIYDINDPQTHSYRGLHLKFERSVDCLLMEKELKMPSRKVDLTKKYYPNLETKEDVLNIMEDSLNKMFNITDGKAIYQSAVKAMYNVIKRFNSDRWGIKKQVYKIIDLFDKKTDMFFTDLSFFNHLENYDYHNDKKTPWNHPITNEEYNYSVMEMYDHAQVMAHEIIGNINDYIFDNKDVDLDKVFTNLSFNSGLDCDQEKPFQYFDIYRK